MVTEHIWYSNLTVSLPFSIFDAHRYYGPEFATSVNPEINRTSHRAKHDLLQMQVTEIVPEWSFLVTLG